MELAERFQLPLVTLIDTPGAYPGAEAEEHGQSAAIGECIYRMSQLSVPTVAIIVGEGGSGGALALGVADTVCMLEYAIYSVISPEGGASILWKDAGHAEAAANALAITAQRLRSLQLIDEVIAEPVGGAHRDPAQAVQAVAKALRRLLPGLCNMDSAARVAMRHARLRAFGAFAELAAPDGANSGQQDWHVIQTENAPCQGAV
jgi:acetyl-CoA carboxylase carboxyl transferase subunit alpha